MIKRSVKSKNAKCQTWRSVVLKNGTDLILEEGWVLRAGLPTECFVLLSSNGETLVSFDSGVFKDKEVFKTKEEVLKNILPAFMRKKIAAN